MRAVVHREKWANVGKGGEEGGQIGIGGWRRAVAQAMLAWAEGRIPGRRAANGTEGKMQPSTRRPICMKSRKSYNFLNLNNSKICQKYLRESIGGPREQQRGWFPVLDRKSVV